MKINEQTLFDMANSQKGLFTAVQAEEAGYSRKNFAYHVRSGKWEKLGRGIYRLKLFPEVQHENLIYWYLWSRNRKGIPQGVISHETALSLYELSDLDPKKIHISVPKSFARSAKIPKGIQIHRASFKNEEIREMEGFKLTTVLRTIIDLIGEKRISEEFIAQAVKEAKKRGMLTQMDFRKFPILGQYLA